MRVFSIAAALLLSAIPSLASDLRLTHATLYTAPGQPPIPDGAILIHNGRIKAIGRTASIKPPHSAGSVVTYDCTGMTITAGFWNSHVHILPPELLHVEHASAPALTAQLQTMFTRQGFTTVFDLSSVL